LKTSNFAMITYLDNNEGP